MQVEAGELHTGSLVLRLTVLHLMIITIIMILISLKLNTWSQIT